MSTPSCGLGMAHHTPITYRATDNEYEVFLEAMLPSKPPTHVVVKQYPLSVLYDTEKDLPAVFRDMNHLIRMKPHPSLAPFLGAYVHREHLQVLRCFARGITLTRLIPTDVDTATQMRIASQLVSATQHLMAHFSDTESSSGFGGEPYSPNNIIFDPASRDILLVDYQLHTLRESVVRKWDNLNRATNAVPMYPPELFRIGSYAGEKSTVFNLAVISYMLAMKKIVAVRRFPVSSIGDQKLAAILEPNLNSDPEVRWLVQRWASAIHTYHAELENKPSASQDSIMSEAQMTRLSCFQNLSRTVQNPPTDIPVQASGYVLESNYRGLTRPGGKGPSCQFKALPDTYPDLSVNEDSDEQQSRPPESPSTKQRTQSDLGPAAPVETKRMRRRQSVDTIPPVISTQPLNPPALGDSSPGSPQGRILRSSRRRAQTSSSSNN